MALNFFSQLFLLKETTAAPDSDKINATEAKRITTVAELENLTENKLPERDSVTQVFWCEEKYIEKMELMQGDRVRLKTKGEGPLIGRYQ